MMESQKRCKAEFHSRDGEDSLPFSSHTLYCLKDEDHTMNHEFYGGYKSIMDDKAFCDCPRCTTDYNEGKP